ncbi:MAG: bacillithiol biosynthesis cysteine-adding enzyme BshC [Acidobacteria bacterium]|nr:MAG: bacillithiol biosynthesis cysteine-adding enzyme BshC [Acidobacteriota bacterium]
MSGEALSALFRDYLFAFDRVAKFYPAGAAFDFAALARQAKARRYSDETRRAVAEDLSRQNPEQREMVARFAQNGTVAILTGQQVGLLGGPLLSLHKAMTAVRIAERLREQGTDAVPIFWMATQDHDLAEVNQAWVLDSGSGLHRLSATFAAEANGQPTGEVRLEESIGGVIDEAERCTSGDWSAVRAAYRPGATLGEAFGELLRGWFAAWGLLVFDPRQAPGAQGLWGPYYLEAFDRQPELAAKLGERAAALTAAGYHVQVEQTAAASMLFLEMAQGRLGVRRSGDRWMLGEEQIAGEELRRRIADAPGRVTPAALLRPVLQDVAFPTVAHVVGPAETAYLAQSAVLYQALGVTQPVAWPRARVTLLDAKAQRLLQKYDLGLDDLRETPAADLLARRALPEGVEQRVVAMRAGMTEGFAQLQRELEQLDPTLLDAAKGAAQKIEHQLTQMETRVARSLARRSGELQAQAQHLDGSLFPNREPQERVLAGAGWLAREPRTLERVHDALDAAEPRPQIIGG